MQIIQRRESLVLFKAFNTLCFEVTEVQQFLVRTRTWIMHLCQGICFSKEIRKVNIFKLGQLCNFRNIVCGRNATVKIYRAKSSRHFVFLSIMPNLHIGINQGVLETNKKKFGSNRNKICFSFVSLFRTFIETIETNRTVSKQTEGTLNFHKNIKICSLSNCFGWSFLFVRFNQNIETLCFGIEAKQPKQTISKQPKTNRKQTEKALNFLKKYQNMLHIKLFRLVFFLFRFNRNIDNLCFGTEAKQPKQPFVLDSAETGFGSSFSCF